MSKIKPSGEDLFNDILGAYMKKCKIVVDELKGRTSKPYQTDLVGKSDQKPNDHSQGHPSTSQAYQPPQKKIQKEALQSHKSSRKPQEDSQGHTGTTQVYLSQRPQQVQQGALQYHKSSKKPKKDSQVYRSQPPQQVHQEALQYNKPSRKPQEDSQVYRSQPPQQFQQEALQYHKSSTKPQEHSQGHTGTTQVYRNQPPQQVLGQALQYNKPSRKPQEDSQVYRSQPPQQFQQEALQYHKSSTKPQEHSQGHTGTTQVYRNQPPQQVHQEALQYYKSYTKPEENSQVFPSASQIYRSQPPQQVHQGALQYYNSYTKPEENSQVFPSASQIYQSQPPQQVQHEALQYYNSYKKPEENSQVFPSASQIYQSQPPQQVHQGALQYHKSFTKPQEDSRAFCNPYQGQPLQQNVGQKGPKSHKEPQEESQVFYNPYQNQPTQNEAQQKELKYHKSSTNPQYFTQDHSATSEAFESSLQCQLPRQNNQQEAPQYQYPPSTLHQAPIYQPKEYTPLPLNGNLLQSSYQPLPSTPVGSQFNSQLGYSENLVERQAQPLKQQVQQQITSVSYEQYTFCQQQPQEQQQPNFFDSPALNDGTIYNQYGLFQQQQQNFVNPPTLNNEPLTTFNNQGYNTGYQNIQPQNEEVPNNWYQQLLTHQFVSVYQNQLAPINQGFNMPPNGYQEMTSYNDHSPPITNNYASLNNDSFHQYQDSPNFPNQPYTEGSNNEHDHQYAMAQSLQNQNGIVLAPIPNHSQHSPTSLLPTPMPSPCERSQSVLVANPNYSNEINFMGNTSLHPQMSYTGQLSHQQQDSLLDSPPYHQDTTQQPHQSTNHQQHIYFASNPAHQQEQPYSYQNSCVLNSNQIPPNLSIAQRNAPSAGSATKLRKNFHTNQQEQAFSHQNSCASTSKRVPPNIRVVQRTATAVGSPATKQRKNSNTNNEEQTCKPSYYITASSSVPQWNTPAAGSTTKQVLVYSQPNSSNHITASPSVPQWNSPAAGSTTKQVLAYSQPNSSNHITASPTFPQRNSPAAGLTTKQVLAYSQPNSSNHITASPTFPQRSSPAAGSTTKQVLAYSQPNSSNHITASPTFPQRNSPAAGSTTKQVLTYSQPNGSNHITADPSVPQQIALAEGSSNKQQTNFNTVQSTAPPKVRFRVTAQPTKTDVGINNVLPTPSTVAPTTNATISSSAFGTRTILRDPHSNRTFKFNYAGSITKRDSVELNSSNELLKSMLSNREPIAPPTSTIQKETVKNNIKSPKEKTNAKLKKSSGNISSHIKTEQTSSTSSALNLVKAGASSTCPPGLASGENSLFALSFVKAEESSTRALNLVKTDASSTCTDSNESADGKAKLKISKTAIAWDGKAESSGLPEEAKQEYQRIKKNADMHKVFYVKKRLHASGKSYVYHVNKSRTGIRIRCLDPKRIMNRAKNNVSSRRSRSKRKMEVNVCQTEIIFEAKLTKKYEEMEKFMIEQCRALERLVISKGYSKQTLVHLKERAGFSDPQRRLG